MSDLISRADAIEAVVSWTVEDRPHEVMPTDLVDRIKALPSADGEWEKTKLKDDMWICSACGSPLMTDDISEIHFCPNCGARMKGGEDE